MKGRTPAPMIRVVKPAAPAVLLAEGTAATRTHVT